jgi:hypothetical protein
VSFVVPTYTSKWLLFEFMKAKVGVHRTQVECFTPRSINLHLSKSARDGPQSQVSPRGKRSVAIFTVLLRSSEAGF